MIENSNDFSMKIEEIVKEKKIPYIDALVDYCDKSGMEIEIAAKLINSKIKECIHYEASQLNLMKEKSYTLPL
jgi:DNA gyrase/topoisomerase IV subunit A